MSGLAVNDSPLSNYNLYGNESAVFQVQLSVVYTLTIVAPQQTGRQTTILGFAVRQVYVVVKDINVVVLTQLDMEYIIYGAIC